ncbi:MAG: DUF1295 domain-containing protein [Gemmatimonadota bacterium]|nr:DUF1295 domain-containing protein [Gemmatimonadota bacterium]
MTTLHLLLPALAGLLAGSTLLWLLSLVRRDASLIDLFWGLGFVLVAGWYSTVSGPATSRSILLLVLVSVWGLRLSVHLARRNLGRGEDFRYAAMRQRWGRAFPIVSLFTVFWLQAVLLWVVSFPLWQAQRGYARAPLGIFDLIGVVLWGTGFFFEAVADRQLARFRRDPANAGQVLDQGLWRYSRHPNYFGDAVLWWGFYLIGMGAPGGWWTFVSPVLMTLLLMRVSGVPLLEETLSQTKPDYRHYTDKTSAFFPWFPR